MGRWMAVPERTCVTEKKCRRAGCATPRRYFRGFRCAVKVGLGTMPIQWKSKLVYLTKSTGHSGAHGSKQMDGCMAQEVQETIEQREKLGKLFHEESVQ